MRSFALAFIAGALLLQQQAELAPVRWAIAALAPLLGATLLARDRTAARVTLFVVAGLLGGFGWAAWRAELRMQEALPFHLEGRDIAVQGVVAGLPQRNERGLRFLFHVEDAAEDVPRSVWLAWYAGRAKGEEGGEPPVLAPAQRWRFTVRLKRPRGGANPHAFDFEPWALERGIRATGYVRAGARAEKLSQRVDGWPYTLHRWRGEIGERMKARLGASRLAGVLVALAIGEQDAIAARDWDVFWRTGVGHLMSISGLHITMLAALGFGIAYFAWVRVPALALRLPARKAAIVAGTLAAAAYCLVTGYAIPAQRTFVMLAVLAACVLADRHGSPSRVLALAALAVVAVDPWSVLSAGFWLSFGAVAAIFHVMALRTGAATRWRSALLEQLAVTVVMLPLLLALFQQVSLVSPLANAFAIALVSLAVVPLTLAGAFLPLPFMLDAAHAVMLLVMQALEAMAAWPLAMVESHAPRPWTLALALAGCAWVMAPRGVPLRSCGAIWIAPLVLIAPQRPREGAAWIDVLDVGNGLAVVVRTASHALAYDAGPTWNADADSGRRIVVPFLRGEGVRRLDGFVVSHADDDHAGGATAVIAARAPPWLLSPLPAAHALNRAVPHAIRCEAGQRWRWDEVEFTVLHPGTQAYAAAPSDGRRAAPRKENDRSCVVRVQARSGSALLTGDVEARSEAEMLTRDGASLAADVLLVPHHGSRTSSSAAFVDAVAPSVALVSAAHLSRFGHPSEAVVERYRARGIELRRTDREGALHVELPAEAHGRITVRGHAAEVRYWSDRRRFP